MQEAESLCLTIVQSVEPGEFLIMVSLVQYPQGEVLVREMSRIGDITELLEDMNQLVGRWNAGGALGLAAHFGVSELSWTPKA